MRWSRAVVVQMGWRSIIPVIVGLVIVAALVDLGWRMSGPRPQPPGPADQARGGPLSKDKQLGQGALEIPAQEAPSVARSNHQANAMVATERQQRPGDDAKAETTRPPRREPVFEQEGSATYYADTYQGRSTASGEPLDQNAFTAASRVLPLGVRATITYLANGKSVDVIINDRGPNVEGRIVDLSKEAARRLEMTQEGVAPVRVVVRPSQQPTPQLRDKVLQIAPASSGKSQ